MEKQSGKIHLNPTDEAIIEKQMTRLKNGEYDHIAHLPECERPAALALRRYCESRSKLGRTVGLQERVAFKLGFAAGREGSAK